MASIIIGDYRYTSRTANTAGVQAVDKTKTSYGAILSSVTIDGVEYNVTDMQFCFFNCTNLITAPDIPNSVIYMNGCFWNCTNLITAPDIPNSVIYMRSCFESCSALQGNITILSNPIAYNYIFSYTQNPITIRPVGLTVGSNNISTNISTWQTIANEYSNVSVVLDQQITYTFLSSRRLTLAENTTYGTTCGVRVDMLLNCGDSYALIGITPSNGRLYTIDDTQITFPYYSPNLLRCYLIYEPSNQVPASKLTITIQNVNTTFNSLQVYLPSTATISQFEQLENSETTQLAPQINNLGSIVFNPQESGASTNVAQLVPLIYQSATGNPLTLLANDNKTQINTLKSDNTLDIKHFVTTADNIQVTTNKTLQDIITECYNALGT